MKSTSPEYLSNYLYDMSRYYEGLFPTTPYGYFSIVPHFVDIEGIPGATVIWTTDGEEIIRDGKRQSALNAREAVLKSADTASRSIPFRADGVFLSAQRLAANEYRVFLVDPGYVEPTGVKTRLCIGLAAKRLDVHDAITGNALPVRDASVAIEVPAGTFRIVDVVVAE